MSIVSVLTVAVRPDSGEAFVQRFAELRVFEHAHESGGFLGGRLLRPLAEDGPFVVVADWASAEAYQAWLDNPVRGELTAQLEPLLESEPVAGELFEEPTP